MIRQLANHRNGLTDHYFDAYGDVSTIDHHYRSVLTNSHVASFE